MSEKEKISLTCDDEKDDCDTDGPGVVELELDSDKQVVEETVMVENRVDPENGERVVEGNIEAELVEDIKEGMI